MASKELVTVTTEVENICRSLENTDLSVETNIASTPRSRLLHSPAATTSASGILPTQSKANSKHLRDTNISTESTHSSTEAKLTIKRTRFNRMEDTAALAYEAETGRLDPVPNQCPTANVQQAPERSGDSDDFEQFLTMAQLPFYRVARRKLLAQSFSNKNLFPTNMPIRTPNTSRFSVLSNSATRN